MYAVEECVTFLYSGSFSALLHDQSCYVTYNDAKLTWFDAAKRCVWNYAHLASFGAQQTTDVGFVDAKLIPSDCAWIGLTQKLFYWDERKSKYLCK